MKFFYYLIALSALLAGISGSFYLRATRSQWTSDSAVTAEIARIKHDFRLQTVPLFDVTFETLHGSRESKILLDPRSHLPQTQHYPFHEISGIYHYAKDCNPRHVPPIKTPALKKASLWQQFVCGRNPKLPDGFFQRDPLIHPSGATYVFLAIQSGKFPFRTPEWIQAHYSGLHLLEIPKVKIPDSPVSRRYSLDRLLPELSPSQLQSLLKEENLLLTQNYVLFRTEDTGYWVYDRMKWAKYLQAQALRASERVENRLCLVKEGNACWVETPGREKYSVRIFGGLLFGSFALLIFVVLGLVAKRARLQKEEMAQKLFMLQMLTHELRTPATSLKISLESLRREFDLLPEASQKAFLALCEETQRLTRVTDASRQYLQSHSGTAGLKFFKSRIPSINEFFQNILESYLDRIRFEPLATDQAASLDPYWVALSVRNLVENALLHGKPPVVVRMAIAGHSLKLSVVDDGMIPPISFEEMFIPFKKGPSSHGLGLGLGIVEKVIRAMGGEISFQSQPTTFTIQLNNL